MLKTFMHRLFNIYPDDSNEARRLGRRPLTIIDEVKAEICHRVLIPSLIDKGGIEGKKEEWWAAGLTVGSLRIAKEQPEGDPYYHAAIYCLNDILEKGVVTMKNNQITITNADLYFEIQKQAAKELLGLYQNPEMTERKAALWIKKRCMPNKKIARGFRND